MNDPLENLVSDDFCDQLPDEVKEVIAEAKEQLKNGEGIPHSQVMADIRIRFYTK